ncbi:DUF47 domain-containing protein [Devriesea agamarum]|uniref:DUF47 domain-containing protein n=1 Tax=Devriesea agamarum TaxID=472569 RepID=UPI00071C7959|nr:DUF47 family protein [Devriesea agamarum]
MRLFLRARERPVHDLFADAAQLLVQGAQTLSRTLGESPAHREALHALLAEHELSLHQTTQRIANRLADSLITPFEAEILHSLALTMDDAVDGMEKAADLTVLFDLGTAPRCLLDLAQVIERAADITAEAIWQLSNVDSLRDFCIEMRRLENHGDRLARQAVVGLFSSDADYRTMLRIRELIGVLDGVVDTFERFSRLVDLLRVKDA